MAGSLGKVSGDRARLGCNADSRHPLARFQASLLVSRHDPRSRPLAAIAPTTIGTRLRHIITIGILCNQVQKENAEY
ncbi:hypothetical protein [Xanthomonas prunicola]|uniref:Uncharacterized protein n=1 Tax=Xanthomonas prunicola TaxID=2053930 RepID=A0A2N3RKX1_9XANT|nr:hypothetical protein [Xanthomonas prunicola]PKV13144.1 hypothetical protein XpruCFBP8353_07750 [Xanthomonas prunicola]PKV17421.1 hypothetical protein XpruCFBP8354_07745 [Xanthomonas prunicola]PKV21317.1 hypothetical protein CVO74_09800 [Xanthomonas prunicola]